LGPTKPFSLADEAALKQSRSNLWSVKQRDSGACPLKFPVLLRSCVVSWDSRFPEPIELPCGAKLASLREAIVHLVNTVPSSERATPVVLTAAELITSAAERGGPIEFARIATLRALNRHVERVLNPDILKSRVSTSFRERWRPNTPDPVHLT
jgi:hypothetical protein